MTQDTLKSCPEVAVDLYALGERQPIRVLHVDDEFSLLKITRECLEMNGPFTVDNASSVDGALMETEVFATSPFSVLLGLFISSPATNSLRFADA